jgi:hypothetical protein
MILRNHWCYIIAPTEDRIYDMKDSFCEELEYAFCKFPKYQAKILLDDFNAKLGREDIFKTSLWE